LVVSNIVKTLEEREWIRVVGYRDVPGKPELFGTTKIFLDYFNLKSLDELPPLAEIHEVEDFDIQMTLAPIATDGDDADEPAAAVASNDPDADPAANAIDESAAVDDPADSPQIREASTADASTPEQMT